MNILQNEVVREAMQVANNDQLVKIKLELVVRIAETVDCISKRKEMYEKCGRIQALTMVENHLEWFQLKYNKNLEQLREVLRNIQ